MAVLAILRSKTNAFPLSTVIVEQYRPPIDKFIIGQEIYFSTLEFPLISVNSNRTSSRCEICSTQAGLYVHSFEGLVDEGETPEQAAIRELEEETGYKADCVVEASPLVVCDPGLCKCVHYSLGIRNSSGSLIKA